MAKEERKPTSEDRTDIVIYDSHGRDVLRQSIIRSESEDDNGVEFYKTEAENAEYGDGTVISPGDLMRATNQGGMTVKRCDICRLIAHRSLFRRNRNVNQFSPVANMRNCFHCRASLCEKHAHVFNNHVVCRHCRRRQFIVYRLLKPLFFRRVTET